VSSGIRFADGEWIADSPMGAVKVRLAGPVEHGVLDHDVTLPGIGVADFERDGRMVAADLERLRAILEA